MKFLKYLRVQIALYYLITSLVVLSFFGVTIYFSIESLFLNQTITTSEQTIDAGSKYLELYVDNLQTVTELVASNQNTISYLAFGQNEKETEKLIKEVLNADDYIRTVIVVSKDGRILSNEKSINMTMSDNMMEESWYVDVTLSDKLNLTGAKLTNFSMNKDNWVISLATQVVNDDNENIGIVIIDFEYGGIENLLSNINLGSEGYAYIINSKDQLVYHSDVRYFEDEVLINELVQMANTIDGYHKEMNKVTYRVELTNSDWRLIGVSSLDGLVVFRRQLLESLLLIIIVLFIVVISSGVYFGGLITKPIKELEHSMNSLDETFSNLVDENIRSSEIKSLAVHYNEMIVKIRKLMDEVNANQKYLRTYEIQALHSQINPHFLYNTLDTIVWMAEFEDSESVIEITKSLANFFRLSLSKGQDAITLDDEFKHVGEYLRIQKLRYQDKLNYTIDISDDLKGFIIPKIVVQPIVENAIYYGVKEKNGPGLIEVSVKEEENIVITIKDDGVGIGKSKLAEINEKLKYGTISYIEKSRSGIGIYNVLKRLKLFYGDKASIVIKSENKKGTIVSLIIPKK